MKSNLTHVVAVLAAFAALIPSAKAAAPSVSLDFNNNTANEVGGSPVTINATAGQTITLQLYVVASGTSIDGVEYWLSQFSGPTTGAFSITNRTLSSNFPDTVGPTDTQVASSADTRSNSTATAGSPDSVPDNQLNPRNGFNLGSNTANSGSAGGDLVAGTYLVATYTISIATNAVGTYQIRTFDYTGHGWSDATNMVFDQAFTNQAAINILIAAVPEPATWSLLGLGGLGMIGMTMLRRRRA